MKVSELFDPKVPYSDRSLAIACTRGRQAVVSHFHELLTEAELTEQQWRVLRVVFDHEPVAVTELCAFCCIHKVSIGRIIRTLMARGLLQRERNVDDLRSYFVTLTPAGQDFLNRLTPNANEIQMRIVERFGPAKSAQLLQLLRELAEVHHDRQSG